MRVEEFRKWLAERGYSKTISNTLSSVKKLHGARIMRGFVNDST
jgi:hypothetical protein